MLAILFRPFGLLAAKALTYLTFQSLDFERHLIKIIPEKRRAH